MKLKKLLALLSAFVLVLGCYTNCIAQTTSQTLTNVRVDELSDTQIRQLITQSGGVTGTQLEQVATSKGMKPEEVTKLRVRVDQIRQKDQKSLNRGSDQSHSQPDTLTISRDTLSIAEEALEQLRSRIFGADLFSGNTSSFEPNLRLATPVNYQVGPDDELLIDLYGYSEASYNLKVSTEGTINIPYVGVIAVGGMTIEQATARIKSRLSTIYSGIQTGNTNVRIAIGNIRSIKVILTGELVKPGTYTIPSVASVFNALYESGGPTENGSFREIEVIRGGKRIATVDIYDFLLKGEFKNNVRLQDNDVIRVPAYRRRVEIVGEVKRPGIYETINNETMSDLLRFASGFTERAYQARVKVLKNTATERKISDIVSENFSLYQPSSGDKFFVDEILNRFENRVTIKGAIFRPGEYELQNGLTLRQLITKAEGLREDAFQNRAYIARLKDDLQTELISFDVASVLAGRAPDVLLKREDIVTISSIFDLKEEYNVRVEGEVRQPGKLQFAEGMTLEDAIIQAGGLKEGATSKRIEVSRRVKNSNVLSVSAQTAEVFHVNIEQDLKSATAGFILQPFDIVAIRPSAGYEVQRLVRIEGEVLYPGIYTITKKDERISDLIQRAGGFTAQAYKAGASLKRPGPPQDSLALRNKSDVYVLKKIRSRIDSLALQNTKNYKSQTDTIIVNPKSPEVNKNVFVGIDLPRILQEPQSPFDIFLEEGDILNVPKQLQTVKVEGEVLSPSTVVYANNRSFKRYVEGAGGFSQLAKKRRSYIRYANGSVKSTKKIFLFNVYPSVKPGAEIIIPSVGEKRPISISELVGITSGLASVAVIIISLLR